MAGILDVLGGGGTPEQNQMLSAISQGLLSANGSMGLGNAMGLLNQLPDINLKRRELAQKIQLGDIGLQQQAQEWAAIQPALAAYAARQAGAASGTAPATSAPSQPAIAPTDGGALGSGTFGLSIGGQPAQSAPASGAPAARSPDPFGLDNVIQGRVVNMFGGAPAASAYWEQFKPTDLMKTLSAANIQPGTPEYEQALKNNIDKSNGPTRLGNSGYYQPGKGFVPLPALAAPGFINIPDPTNPSGFKSVQIGGGAAAVAASAEAQSGGKAAGSAPYDGPVTIPTSDGRSLTLSKPEYADYQKTGVLPSRYSRSPVGAPSPSGPAPSMNQSQFNSNPDVRRMAQAQPDGAMVLKNEYGGDPAKVQADIQQITGAIAQAKGNPTVQGILQGRLNTLNAAAMAGSGSAAPAGNLAPVGAPASTAPIVGMTPPMGAQQGASLGQDELSAKGKALMADNGQTNTVISRLQNIKMLAPGAITGAEGNRRDFLNGLLSLAGIQGAIDLKTASDLVDKNQSQIVSALRMGQGGAGTDALQTLLGAANPNRHMTNDAIQEAADQLIASQKMIQAKAQLLQPHYLGRDPAAYGAKELQFDQNADPRVWQLQNMTPQQQATYVKTLPPAVAADLLQKRQALKSLGVLQ